jgi:radical SAM superfamily enzyme YgiQ (UPF0313 family)
VLHLAAGLRARGLTVRIADLNVDVLTPTLLEGVVIAGISCTSYSIGTALKAAAAIRSVSPSASIIWGGVHPSLDPVGTVGHPLVDAVLLGEGDFAFAEVSEHLINGGTLASAPHVFTRSKLGSSCTVNELDRLPSLPYDLLRLERYNDRLLDVHSARGCPFTCGFCYNQHKDYRSKSPDRIYEDIMYGLRFFRPGILVFCEDMFFSKFSKVAAVCEMLLGRRIELPWTANCRIEHILGFEPDFWQLLRDSRCSLLKVGVESGSPRMQALMGKADITQDMVVRAVELCKQNGIGLKLNFIVGFPSEAIDDLLDTVKLISRCIEIDPCLRRIAIGVYDPYPNTSLWPLALRAGYDAPRTLDEWGKWRGEIHRLRWLTNAHVRSIRNLLFLTMVFDEPYVNSIDGLWCRQPRVRTRIQRTLWRVVKHLIRQDFKLRSKFGAIRYTPERHFYELIYAPIGLTSAPQPGMD